MTITTLPLQQILQHLFQADTLEEVPRERLEEMVSVYPSFPIAHYLLSRKLRAEDAGHFMEETQKTNLYFGNPFWLQWLLRDTTSPAVSTWSVPATRPNSDHDVEQPPASWETADPGSTGNSDPVDPAVPAEEPVAEFITPEEEVFQAGERVSEPEESEPEEIALPEEIASSEDIALPEAAPQPEAFHPEAEIVPAEDDIDLSGKPPEETSDPTGESVGNPVQSLEHHVDFGEVAEEGNPIHAIHDVHKVNGVQTDITAVRPPVNPVTEIPEEAVGIPEEAVPEMAVRVDEAPVPAQAPAPAPDTKLHTPAPSEAPFVFQAFHTIDYFASQGIRLMLEENPSDKLGKQLKSFTDWLKDMRRLPQKDRSPLPDLAAEQDIQLFAAHSIERKDIVTEAMAEVLAKQGMREKASEVYHKLSLLNPGKSAYFAAKIEQLKID